MDFENIQTIESNFANTIESTENPAKVLSSELNKLRGSMKNQPGKKYADIPRMTTAYYPRPTPQDVLIEERDWNITNTSYNGDAIYEWNIDGLSDRQKVFYHTVRNSIKFFSISVGALVRLSDYSLIRYYYVVWQAERLTPA